MQAATLFSHTPADHTLFHEICTMQTLSSQLHNAGDFVLHEEHIEGMTTICSEVLPSATHPGLSGAGQHPLAGDRSSGENSITAVGL